MRIFRAIAGTLLLVLALPMLIAGGALWEVSRHRDADGAFRARIEPLRAEGSAIVVWDIDRLLRQEAAFARGGRTTLRIDAPGRFIGLAARTDVERYLAGAAWLAVDRVRLARGPLPVDAAAGSGVPGGRTTATAGPSAGPNAGPSVGPPLGPPVGSEPPAGSESPVGSEPPAGGESGGGGAGTAGRRPAAPLDQTFWRLYATPDRLGPFTFAPSALRGGAVALVIMNPDAAPAVSADVSVAVAPRWLDQTTLGVLILGTVLLLVGIMLLGWPRPRRDIVYVVGGTAALPEIAAKLGLPAPLAPAEPATALPPVHPVPPPVPAEPVTVAVPPVPAVSPPAPAVPPVQAVPPAATLPVAGLPPVSVHLEWPPPPSRSRTAAPVPASSTPTE